MCMRYKQQHPIYLESVLPYICEDYRHMCGIQAVVSYCERDYSLGYSLRQRSLKTWLTTTTVSQQLLSETQCPPKRTVCMENADHIKQEVCFDLSRDSSITGRPILMSRSSTTCTADRVAMTVCIRAASIIGNLGRSVHRRGRSFSRGSARRRSWNYFSFCSWLSNSVGISLKELAVRCRNVWNFAPGLKFKTDFHSTMSVCRHMNWGVEPPIPGNSNTAFESVLYW